MSLQGRLTLLLVGLLLTALAPLGAFTVREARQAALATLQTSALARLGFYREVYAGQLAPLSAIAQEYGGYGFLEWQGRRRLTDTAAHRLPEAAEAAIAAGVSYAALHGDELVLVLPLAAGAVGLVLRAEPVEALTRRLILVYGVSATVLLAVGTLVGRWLLAALLAPLRTLNREVQQHGPDTFTPLTVPALPELRPTVARLNALLEELQQALRRSTAQAEAAKRFAAHASHELRTPLSALQTYWDILKRRPGDPQASAGVERLLGRLTKLLGALLTLARLEGRAQVALEPIALGAFVAERFPELPLAGDARILAEPALLELAVGNLLGNARRYGAPPVTLGVKRAGARVWLHVEDSGPGFPDDLLENALEPFVQGGAQGSGLGLAIVRAVAEAHGGEVRLANRPEGGARVSLSFREAPASALAHPRSPR